MLAMWLKGWQYIYNTPIGGIVMNSGTVLHASLRINCNNFGDSLIFDIVPSSDLQFVQYLGL